MFHIETDSVKRNRILTGYRKCRKTNINTANYSMFAGLELYQKLVCISVALLVT